ncbi:MAG: hypothetical protein IJK28_02570 [Clostridia bacterium]|nr:hypothetical protein [Clostridia bacterium]
MPYRTAAAWACLLLTVCLFACASAETPEVCLAEPLLPGAQTLRIRVEADVALLRANAFCGEESIASAAAWDRPFLTVMLSRPPETGEAVQILVDGEDTDGAAFAWEHTAEASATGALRDVLARMKALWEVMPGAGGEAFAAAVPLRELAALAPVLLPEEEICRVRLDDRPARWRIVARDSLGRGYSGMYAAEADGWTFGDGIGGVPDVIREIVISASPAVAGWQPHVAFTWEPGPRPVLRAIEIDLAPATGGRLAFSWEAAFDGAWHCIFVRRNDAPAQPVCYDIDDWRNPE